MKLGPAMIDVEGLELTKADVERLEHPQAGGVILFARNFDNPHQLVRLTRAIRKVRAPRLPICVDHEGGRVQRFRKGFTRIPPMAELGRLHGKDPSEAIGTCIHAPFTWKSIGLGRDPKGKPLVVPSPEMAKHLKKLGVTGAHVSLTDDAGVAVAFVVLEGKDK